MRSAFLAVDKRKFPTKKQRLLLDIRRGFETSG